ncbi:hypothetical protein AB1K83_03840 [Sporosarcina sp. 179-K 3D1 HS]|uniref:hypothetical protein n=1 Tax=Sporosarcina sp. 179-K 3D1 HS TaxID=3232169 RepID=UPI0039A35B1E
MKLSRVVDVLLILFVGYLAIIRFKEGMTGIGIMFTALAFVYLVTFIVRIKNEREKTDNK